MFKQTNPNPSGSYVGDCVVRAIALASGKSWDEVYISLCLIGLTMYDMPSSNRVWHEYLKSEGYKRYLVSDDCPGCYTVRDFCNEFFRGTYILGTGTHAICIKDGNILDSWDSSDESPIYFWTKEEL